MYEVFEYTVCKRGLPVARVKNQTPVKPGNQRNKIYKIYLECHKPCLIHVLSYHE